MQWNGNGGETIFFQNEMPYDPPNQAAWMNGSSRVGVIEHVINTTGGATPSNTTPVDVTTYP